MKEYRATIKVSVFFYAEDEDDAQNLLEDMDYTLTNPYNGDELQAEIIDWDVAEINEDAYPECDDGFDDE